MATMSVTSCDDGKAFRARVRWSSLDQPADEFPLVAKGFVLGCPSHPGPSYAACSYLYRCRSCRQLRRLSRSSLLSALVARWTTCKCRSQARRRLSYSHVSGTFGRRLCLMISDRVIIDAIKMAQRLLWQNAHPRPA